MEEECERVEAEIEKEKVHNENRLLKVSLGFGHCFPRYFRKQMSLLVKELTESQIYFKISMQLCVILRHTIV